MYRKGHYGVALLVFAPIGFALLQLGRPTLAFATGVPMLWFAMLPDYDQRVPFLPHRGPTHSLAFAGLVGAVFGGGGYLLAGAAPDLGLAPDGAGLVAGLGFAAFGFFVGAVTVVAHLLADALTPAGVNFLWPLSGRTYSVSLTTADSAIWNYALFALGVFATAAALYLSMLL